jgi:hypothetical protein
MLRLPSMLAEFALTFLIIGLLTGCGIFAYSGDSGDNREQLSLNPADSASPEEPTSSVVPLVPGQSKHRLRFSSIEIDWLVPSVPVDGFVDLIPYTRRRVFTSCEVEMEFLIKLFIDFSKSLEHVNDTVFLLTKGPGMNDIGMRWNLIS